NAINGTVEGDRLWVVTGSEVRAYDLASRDVAGELALPGADALAYDKAGHVLYVGMRSGEIRAIDVGALDATRRGPPVTLDSRAFLDVGGPIQKLYVNRSGDRLVAVLEPGAPTTDGATPQPNASQLVVIDAGAATEISRPSL